MKKTFILFLVAVFVFGNFGCATAKRRNNGIASHLAKIFSISDSDKDASIVVGFKVFEDKRPKQDISYLTSIKEKASEKILDNIKQIQLFDEINYPPLDSDNIIITGEIRKFSWESTDTMISYVPGLNILPFLGLPSNRVHSEVEVYVEFRNKKANAVIFGFVEEYKKDRKFNIYNFRTEKAEEDLASCFKIVLSRIKEKIILNRSVIIDTVKLGIFEPIKPVEEVQQQPELVEPEPIESKPIELEPAPAPEIQEVPSVDNPATNTTQETTVNPQ